LGGLSLSRASSICLSFIMNHGILESISRITLFFDVSIRQILAYTLAIKWNPHSMKRNVLRNPGKKPNLWFVAFMLVVASALTGCARPNDENITEMLSNTYKCKWLKVEDFEKTESLPGIWTYVAKYSFKLKFADGEAGAENFFRGLYHAAAGEKDWQKVLQNPKAYAYLKDECSPPAIRVMEQVAIHIYMQLEDQKKTSLQIPVSIPINGWAEMSTGRVGWGMDVRRDKVDANFVVSSPIRRAILTSKPKVAALAKK